MARFWEDYNLGDKSISPGRTLTDGLVTMFAALVGYTDPFIVDEEAAKKSVFGTRVAPGSLTLAFGDKLGFDMDEETYIALVGLEGRFKMGAKVGDTVRVESEIVEKKPTKDPARGILIEKSIVRNQLGAELVEVKVVNMVKRKPK